MVNREQEQARLLAESLGADGRAGRDLGWIVAAGVVVLAVGTVAGVGVALGGRAGQLDDEVLGTVLLLLGLLAVGALVYAVRRYRDATIVRAAVEQLSYRDSLTGLPNRRFLGSGLDAMLARSRRTGRRLAVIFLDLHGVPRVNDTHGHEVGDQLLVTIGDRLVEASGPDDVVVRYGGDEFMALCSDVADVDSAERQARRYLRAVEAPFARGEELVKVSASVGVALAEERCERPDEVLQDADAARYLAKLRGPGSHLVFDRQRHDHLTPSTAERRLRSALEDGELQLFYRPIVSLWTHRLVGVEARLCWDRPGGPVAVDEFQDALEDTGLSVPVGNWMLEEACRQAQRWQDRFADRPAPNVKVAVSARQLAQTDFADRLRHALAVSGADPDRLCLEITEGALAHDVTTAWATLREVKAAGLTLALDGVGTGSSSLGYLRRFSLDLLTIDRLFVDGVGRSREDDVIVEHLVGMAKALGIVTVADGVVSEEQVELLRGLQCDLAQGPHFSGPQPAAVIDELLAGSGPDHEWRPADDRSGAAVGPAAAVPGAPER